MNAVTIADLTNAKLDTDTIATFASSTALKVTDRLGNTKSTLAGMNADEVAARAVRDATEATARGARGYEAPVTYAAGINLTRSTQTVSYGGLSYAPDPAFLPFTTTGTFETAKFKTRSGVTAEDLAAPAGTVLVGHKGRTVADVFAERSSIVDLGLVKTATAAANTTALATIEALPQTEFYVPEGSFAVNDSTTFNKKYKGPGKWNYGGELLSMTQPSPVDSVIGAATALGDLTRFAAAIRAGTLTVVIAGDSISEGVYQVSYEDAWAGLFATELRRRLPGVNVIIKNLSIGGTGITDLASASYVGVASGGTGGFYKPDGQNQTYPTNQKDFGCVTGNPDLWPGGSVAGKSWRDHVKDAAADLVIIAHGANDVDANSANWNAQASSFISYANTWAKVPSIAIMTACPSTRKQALWRGYAPNIQTKADAARSIALQKNCTLLDANRIYMMYRDGVDTVNVRNQAISGLTQLNAGTPTYPTGWGGSITPPAMSGGVVTFTTAGKIYGPQTFKDGHLSGVFSLTSTGQAVGLIYRYNNVSGLGYEFQVNGFYAVLYWGTTNIASASITPISGADNVLDVVVKGARHTCRLNGVVVIDFWDYNSLVSGQVGVEINGAGSFKSFGIQSGVARTVAVPVLTEDELLGFSPGDYYTNAVTLGGDGIHHPSHIGHYAVWFASTLGLIQYAETVFRLPPATAPLSVAGSATTGALASTDFLSVSIGGAVGSAAMVTGSGTALAASPSCVTAVTLAAGASVTCALLQNGTTTLCTATFVAVVAGRYTVFATANGSQQGATIRHSLSVIALP